MKILQEHHIVIAQYILFVDSLKRIFECTASFIYLSHTVAFFCFFTELCHSCIGHACRNNGTEHSRSVLPKFITSVHLQKHH